MKPRQYTRCTSHTGSLDSTIFNACASILHCMNILSFKIICFRLKKIRKKNNICKLKVFHVRALINNSLSNINKCTIYIVHSPTYALLLNLEMFKIYVKRHINIAPTCFGLRPSSGSLYRAWLKLYFC